VDHLFDQGFISFEDTGQLIVSPVADSLSLKRMGIDPDSRANVGAFSQGQRRYLDFHRENVLRIVSVSSNCETGSGTGLGSDQVVGVRCSVI